MSVGGSSTPLEASRFEKRIDSFTLDNSSPSWASSTATSASLKQTTREDIRLEDTRLDDTSPREGSNLEDHNQQGHQQPTEEERSLLDALVLRSGRRIRRRSKSVSGEQHNIFSSKQVVKNLSLRAKETVISMERVTFVSQLVLNNIPMLGADVGANLANEVDIFIRCCEYLQTCLPEEEDQKIFLRLLPTKLRGRAASVLDGVEYKTIEELKNILITRLVITKSYQGQLNDLRNCRQFPGENVSEYGQRILQLHKGCKTLAKQKYPLGVETIYSDLEETAIFTFKAGIVNPHHRFYLLNDTENSLVKVIQKAERLEVAESQMLAINQPIPLNKTNPYSYPVLQSYGDNPFNNISPSPVQQPTTINDTLAHAYGHTSGLSFAQPNIPQNLQPQQQIPYNYQQNPIGPTPRNYSNYNKTHPANRSPTIKCNFCNRSNHTYAECRVRKATPFCTKCKAYGHDMQNCARNSSGFKANVMEIRSDKIKCNFCQRSGHGIEQCRAKKTWEENYDNQNTQSQGN